MVEVDLKNERKILVVCRIFFYGEKTSLVTLLRCGSKKKKKELSI